MDLRLGLVNVAFSSALVLCGCGDDSSSGTDSDGSSGSTSTSTTATTTTTTSTSSTTDPTGSSTTDDSTTGSTGGTAGTGSTGGTGGTGSTGGTADCHPVLAEVVYNPEANPDMLQWVKIYNPCDEAIDLTQYTIAYGGDFYTQMGTNGPRKVDLSDANSLATTALQPGECELAGGPTQAASNGDPAIDVEFDFSPSLDVAAVNGNAVALMTGPFDDVDQDSVPVDAVIYGPNNANSFVDATGVAPANAMVANPAVGGSIQRTAMDTWVAAGAPVADTCPSF